MRRLTVALIVLASLASLRVDAATRDSSRPSVRHRTPDGSILISNPAGLTSDQIPLEAKGTATDSGTGIKRVTVTWLRCTYGDSSGCTVLGPWVEDPVGSTVTLACNATRRSCTWRATAPAIPGSYLFVAEATDRAGNRSRGSGILDLIVV